MVLLVFFMFVLFIFIGVSLMNSALKFCLLTARAPEVTDCSFKHVVSV